MSKRGRVKRQHLTTAVRLPAAFWTQLLQTRGLTILRGSWCITCAKRGGTIAASLVFDYPPIQIYHVRENNA